MKTHISIRINKITERQIAELRQRYNQQQTEVITMAVDQFYKSKMEEKMETVKTIEINLGYNSLRYGVFEVDGESQEEETLNRWSDNYRAALDGMLKKSYPGAQVDVSVVPCEVNLILVNDIKDTNPAGDKFSDDFATIAEFMNQIMQDPNIFD